jgi:UDP-N-acetylmuramoylalanine-D-glutamate ligase
MSIKATLAQRQKTHGEFSTHAEISQKLKAVMREHGLLELSPDKIEALEMIAHKIARVLNGNPEHHDHWHDISGYAECAAKLLK